MTETIPTPTRLPFRAGSIQMRHGSYWAVYTASKGNQVQLNTQTADSVAALRWCAERVAAVLRVKLFTIETIANGAGTEGYGYGLSAAQRAEIRAAVEAAQGDAQAGTTAGRTGAGRSIKAAGRNRAKAGKGGTR